MSDEKPVVNQPEKPVESVFDAVNAEVKAKVTEGSQGLRGRVVDKLTKDELDKRLSQLLEGLKKVGELRTEGKKLSKPTNVAEKLVDGKWVKEESFAPDAVKKIKENQEKLAKLEAALGKAFNNADFEALKKAGVGGGSGNAEGEEKAAE